MQAACFTYETELHYRLFCGNK